ncbi:GAF sensor signal transduction histidine kinase [Flammeovirgaceae bacterium 311]|nr:GAF sensor signal transduction histidine kinase [Flammeovirgaceae bacterium 311]
MEKAPLPPNEDLRLLALQRYQLLDTGSEEQFDDIVKLASQICNTPVSLISLVDSKRQWFKARKNFSIPEISREYAFCAHTILSDELLVIEDATADDRFKNNPLVTGDPDIRFYAGAPLITHDQYRLGALCVIDRIPRNLSDHQKFALKVLAGQVVKLLELRYQNLKLAKSLQTVSLQKKRIQSLLQERVKLTEELAKTSHTKDQMLSIVAHDLRSPLHTLQNLLMLMSAKKAPLQDAEKYTTALGKSVKNAINLLENLLEWGRIQLEGQEPEKQQVNLHAIVEQQLSVLQNAAEEKGNVLRNLIPQDTESYGNTTSLNIVLRNLLINANKFTAGGVISIFLEQKPDAKWLVIQDTGVGMEPAVLAHLFDLNKKQNRSGTNNEKGSGLGLHMSREVLQQMGGSLLIESSEGKGTIVTVILPEAKKTGS